MKKRCARRGTGSIIFSASFAACALSIATAANAQTSNETVLRSFNSFPNGGDPYAGVIRDSDGNLYGTTQWGGTENAGTVYKWDAAGHVNILYSFKRGSDGVNPTAGVVRDPMGNLYGTTVFGGTHNVGIVYKISPSGGETVLHNFTGGSDGGYPGALTLDDTRGILYGNASQGGAGKGLIYKMDRAGHESVMYTFKGGADGGEPSGVSLDAARNVYGTTAAPEAASVFMIVPAGKKTVLYAFDGGCHPDSGVTLDSAGNMYGTTKGCGTHSRGFIYKLTPAGAETTLYNFDEKYGAPASGQLVLDAAGNIYGTTLKGGETAPGANYTLGVVYELNPAGTYTVLHYFSGVWTGDGEGPGGGVILDSSGNLYGTTEAGGTANSGVIFEINAAGQESILYSFPAAPNGSYPDAGVVRDGAGNLYGTTYNGGTAGLGLVYKLDPAGNETALYNFTGVGADGANPYAGVVRTRRAIFMERP